MAVIYRLTFRDLSCKRALGRHGTACRGGPSHNDYGAFFVLAHNGDHNSTARQEHKMYTTTHVRKKITSLL